MEQKEFVDALVAPRDDEIGESYRGPRVSFLVTRMVSRRTPTGGTASNMEPC
jgi:hypothetical protein